MRFVVTLAGAEHSVDVTRSEGRYRLSVGDQVWDVDAHVTADGLASLIAGGVSYVADVAPGDDGLVVDVAGETYVVQVEDEGRHAVRRRGGGSDVGGGQTVKAPMPGKVTHVGVRPGDAVQAGDTLVVIEAMKMENELKAAAPGTVAEVRVQAGQAVNPGDVLVVIA